MPISANPNTATPPPPPVCSTNSQHPQLTNKPSLNSLSSDLSSDCSRRVVSFNNDVSVKRIPKSKLENAAPTVPARVTREAPPNDTRDIAHEAELILKQLAGVECSASPIPPPLSSAHTDTPSSDSQFQSNNNSNTRHSSAQMHVDSSDPAPRTQSSNSSSTNSLNSSKNDNRLYGLHALNNLDIAVNGKNVNSMQSYHAIRRSQNHLDSSSAEAEAEAAAYSPSFKRHNNLVTPPKPPRKAPSTSPPSMRRSYNNGQTMHPSSISSSTTPHYSQPSATASSSTSSQMVSSMMEQLGQDSRFRRRQAETTSGDEDGTSASNITSSYSSQQHQQPVRKPMPPPPPPPRPRLSISPSRLSPSRACMTDTELLRSPTEVLYAVSDKHRHGHNSNERVAHSASQTMQSELMQHPTSRPGTYDRRNNNKNVNSHRARSREDLLDNRNEYSSHMDTPSYHQKHASRSLDRHIDDDKENTFKARIHVTSPNRELDNRNVARKPYKTTINTATDNIQYRGAVNAKSKDRSVSRSGSNLYQKNHLYKRNDTEHYKVPKNRAPVEYLRNGSIRPGVAAATDSDHSSSVYYNAGHARGSSAPSRTHFNSTRLVKNVESRRHAGSASRELDREGRTIRRPVEGGGGRGRTYSGCSTSPDREGSPDRYGRPMRSASYLNRSPSTSPTRPPRARSSPGRELISSVVRKVTRSPSTRATTTSRSPIKDIRRVHNDIREKNLRDRSSERILVTKKDYEDSEDRLSRFTEYRGDDGGGGGPPPTHYHTERPRRGSSIAHNVSSRQAYGDDDDDDELAAARERGQSLPPGATIDSMRDFYKSSQYKSMYALPPSPSRPAPVLDRAPSSSTLARSQRSAAARPSRVSISEGEMTDDRQGPAAVEKVIHHRPQPRTNPRHSLHTTTINGQPVKPKRPSAKRQAPSPPGHLGVRRVVSSDREDAARQQHRMNTENIRRVHSTERGLQHPPARRPLNRKASDGIDSSYSESEGFNGDHEQEKQLGEFGRRWTNNSDIDSDYRRDLATNGVSSGSGLHQEARGRDGGGSSSTYGTTTGTLRKRSGEHHGGASAAAHRRGSGDDRSGTMGRSSSSAREEERRKVLEIEEERLRREREVQMRRGIAGQVSRSASRVSRANAGGQATLGPRSKSRTLAGEDHDSQYSGHSSSSAMRGPKEPVAKPGRFDQGRLGRVKRSTSSAGAQAGAGGQPGVRVVNRKKMPGSVTSSLNSSESEHSNANAQAAGAGSSSATGGGGGGGGGQRSVYLHAACVADIPTPADMKPRVSQQRALSAESRENLAGGGGGGGGVRDTAPSASNTSNLKNSKKISRSISLLAPWKPRTVQRQFEIHYDNSAIYNKQGPGGKPPRPPPTTAGRRGAATMQRGDKKSASSSDLLRDDVGEAGESIVIGRQAPAAPPRSNKGTLGRKPAPPITAGGGGGSKVSRSVSMPKDSRLAGWFKKRKRV